MEHSHASLTDVKRWSGIEGDLFDTLLVYQSVEDSHASVAIDDFVEMSSVSDGKGSTEFSVEMVVEPSEFVLTVTAFFNNSRISRWQASSILLEFEHSLCQAVDALSCDCSSEVLWCLRPFEVEIIEDSSSGSVVPLPFELLHHEFEQRATRHPDYRAIEFEDKALSYGELNAQANALAWDLAALGVCVGSCVAVIMERCLEFPVGLLAVLKVGGTMLPLDADFPPSRLLYMLRDSNACAVVTTETCRNRIEILKTGLPVVFLPPTKVLMAGQVFQPKKEHLATRHNEAYIVYTSGSTGQPKGVPVLHVGAVNVVQGASATAIGYVEGARVYQFLAIGFDGFQFDLWKTLSHGATLVLRSPNGFDAMKTVDVMLCTPTALGQLGDPTQYPNLKVVCVGGESCPLPLVKVWSRHVKLLNLYGPSECAIVTHFGQLHPDKPVTIGKPIDNVSCYILDAKLRRVPVGVAGEMYLGGMCVSRGYINLPAQSKHAFIQDPISGNGLMYRTGDVGRLLLNGDFEILGRRDSQVKLKGYRVELDEVAEAIMRFDEVAMATAVVKEKTHLVAYFAPATVDLSALKDFVAGYLPDYMIPATWVGLDTLPMNCNGKIDKKALQGMDIAVEIDALVSDLEVQLAAVWASVLGISMQVIGRDTSFFALGGDSLSAVKTVSACRKLGFNLTVAQLVKAKTVSRTASLMARNVATKYPSAALSRHVVTSDIIAQLGFHDATVYPVTPLQAVMLQETVENREAYLLQMVLAMPQDMDDQALFDAVKRVVQHNEILRTSFVAVDSTFYQVIRSTVDDLSFMSVGHTTLEVFLRADRKVGCTPGDRNFVRFAIVRDDACQRHAVLSIHHALYDGWSLSMVTSDILNAYATKSVAMRPQFRAVVDYIEATKQECRAFWTSYLRGAPLSLQTTWPSDLDTPVEHSNTGVATSRSLRLSATELTETATGAGIALSTLLQFAWATTLQNYTKRAYVTFALTLANRSIPVQNVDRMMGPLINDVPCRVEFTNPDDSLQTSLDKFQSEHSALLSHAFASLDEIKAWSGVEATLCDSLFMFQNFAPEPSYNKLEFHPIVADHGTSNIGGAVHTYAFTLVVEPTATGALEVHGTFDPTKLTATQTHIVLRDLDDTLSRFHAVLRTNRRH
ncbi:hypothetical protein DYB32_010051 [Aphanomyces invadans]|uniref:Carrier domain-containing protein n=1 Tax=Aphanomyces invadans TaxID=157072 RepID=A0A3R6WEL5_9STRA|nr:hypothetical protein DYB32_010051 [Aphanomyces invadans]